MNEPAFIHGGAAWKRTARRPVSRVLSGTRRRVAVVSLGDHSSGTPVARRLARHTRRRGPADRPGGTGPPPSPYSVLLLAGFAVPPSLRSGRWALAPPFHPCRRCPKAPEAVCSLWHCPWSSVRRPLQAPSPSPGGRYPPPCLLGARTFLPCGLAAGAGAAARPPGATIPALWRRPCPASMLAPCRTQTLPALPVAGSRAMRHSGRPWPTMPA